MSQDDGPMPLYLHTVYRILRDMRIEQQEAGMAFDYQSFKRRLTDTAMTPTQLGPLNQRLDILESFMPKGQTAIEQIFMRKREKQGAARNGNDWISVVCSTYIPLHVYL